jgi:deazaflavin-dependent oxidoreductase (nitroreductase family)
MHVGLAMTLMKAGIQGHVWLYQTSKGRLGSMGGKTILLTTTGRRTGKRRIVPLMHVRDGKRILVTATAGGDDKHPGWYHNLTTNPAVEVQIGPDVSRMTARPAGPEERDALYQRFVDGDSRFADYESRTERIIPVVILEPAG